MADDEIDPGEAAYDYCSRLGCQEAEMGNGECRELCEAAAHMRRKRRGPSGPNGSNAAAGYLAMRDLMQRARDDRDYGGAVDG